jgi:hypothetical protein
MTRRAFITLLGGAAAAWPRTLMAQRPDRVRRIGVLMELAASDSQARSNVAALQRGLKELGWLEGSNLGIDYRWAPDDAVLVWKFAKELVELRPDVIVAHSSPVVATLLVCVPKIRFCNMAMQRPIQSPSSLPGVSEARIIELLTWQNLFCTNCVIPRFDLGLVAQNHVQQGIMDFQFSVVFDKTQFAEFVHEKTYA